MDPLSMWAVGSAIVGGAVGLYNGYKQRQAQREANEANMAFNSPEAQKERYRAANLNPNLIYSNGNTVGNTEIKPVDAYGMESTVKNALGTYMQIKNFDADLRAKENTNKLTSATMPSTIAQAQATAARVQTDSDVAKATLRESKAKADIAEHNRDVITGKKVGLLSNETGMGAPISAFARWVGKGIDYLGDGIRDIGSNILGYFMK